MNRLRLYDIRMSDFPEAVGACVDDVTGIAAKVNDAETNLLHCKEVGEEGWWGTWAEIQFTASKFSPYVTLPREVARLEQIDVCGHPVQNNNQFYEYLRFGNGRARHHGFNGEGRRRCGPTQAYQRNNAVTQTDLFPAPQLLSVYITNPVDVGKRIFIGGLDSSGNQIYSQDALNRVMGVFVPFEMPFSPVTYPGSSASIPFNQITGIQKDVTAGQVQVFQVDPVTGVQSLILTMEPGEQTAWYRRYLLDPLPWNCCHQPSTDPTQNIVHLTAVAMLEHIPVAVDTDYLLIQERRALMLEARANRMQLNDSPAAQAQAREYHLQAVRLLIGQTSRYTGIDNVAIQFRPFGSATLARAGVGRII